MRTQSGPYHRLESEVIHRLILPEHLGAGSRILDVGSGPGIHALRLARQGHHVTLVDISEKSLTAARRRFDEAGLAGQVLHMQHTSAHDMDIEPGRYDAVLLFGPLYHLLDDHEAAECVRRAAAALRPGGHLFAIFLTRTSILRDLLKRGRFDDIRTLLASGYLDHGRYLPLSPASRDDYMPATRTHRLAEAEQLLSAAGLMVVARHAVEGVAAWMRPYVDEVAADAVAFAELSEVVRATAGLDELIEAGDHFLLTARAGTPSSPARSGSTSVPPVSWGARSRVDVIGRDRSVAAGADGQICFAPAATVHQGRRLLAVTVGPAADRVFVPRQLPGRAPEPWYTGGHNRIRIYRSPQRGPVRLDDGHLVPMPAGTVDATGACLVSEGTRLRLWFSARTQDGPWQIYQTVSCDGARTWCEPTLALAPDPAHGSTQGTHVLLPAVLRRRDGWWMWHAGHDGEHRRIHLARSDDGLTWQRHHLALDLGPTGSCDAYAADCPAVTELPDGGLLMLYGAGTSRSLAAARSDNGLHWHKIGPVLHRGTADAPDTRYAFYPALLPTGHSTAELYYAGEDDTGRWQVMTAGTVDLALLAERPAPLELTAGIDQAVARLRDEVPATFWEEPDDCHADGGGFSSADGRLQQIRPASTPVFTARTDDAGTVVVKFGRSRTLVEREHSGLQSLGRYLPVPTTSVHYTGEAAALIAQHIEGTRLAELAGADPERFREVLVDLTAHLVHCATATLTAHATAAADHTRKTPAVATGWVEDLARQLRGIDDLPLHLNGTRLESTIGGLIHLARRHLPQPRWLIHNTGDMHLNNVLVTDSNWYLLDGEFTGLHDLDHVVATLLSSVLKHTRLLTGAHVVRRPDGLHLDAGLRGPLGPELLGTPWLLDRFDGLPVDPARVLAHLLPELYFRLTTTAPDPTEPAPAAGLAALALATRMTRHGATR